MPLHFASSLEQLPAYNKLTKIATKSSPFFKIINLFKIPLNNATNLH